MIFLTLNFQIFINIQFKNCYFLKSKGKFFYVINSLKAYSLILIYFVIQFGVAFFFKSFMFQFAAAWKFLSTFIYLIFAACSSTGIEFGENGFMPVFISRGFKVYTEMIWFYNLNLSQIKLMGTLPLHDASIIREG